METRKILMMILLLIDTDYRTGSASFFNELAFVAGPSCKLRSDVDVPAGVDVDAGVGVGVGVVCVPMFDQIGWGLRCCSCTVKYTKTCFHRPASFGLFVLGVGDSSLVGVCDTYDPLNSSNPKNFLANSENICISNVVYISYFTSIFCARQVMFGANWVDSIFWRQLSRR